MARIVPHGTRLLKVAIEWGNRLLTLSPGSVQPQCFLGEILIIRLVSFASVASGYLLKGTLVEAPNGRRLGHGSCQCFYCHLWLLAWRWQMSRSSTWSQVRLMASSMQRSYNALKA